VRAAVHSRGSRSGQRARDWSTAAHADEDHLTSSTDDISVLKVRKKHLLYSDGHLYPAGCFIRVYGETDFMQAIRAGVVSLSELCMGYY